MPNRMIKDSINESRGLTSCSLLAQDLYKRLITYADDYGRFNADPQVMLARLYPRELAVITLNDLMDGLVELAGEGKIRFYTAEARKEVYGAFPNWENHQRLRNSKKKLPDPADTTVNDLYLRRFIPMDMKIAIIERDGFKCQICGKHLWTEKDAGRFAKLGAGLFHIDHEVPAQQGGRATMENLRLTCPTCNLSRKKAFSFAEILEFAAARRDSPQLAANRGQNPIQSETESETETKEDEEDARPPVDEIDMNSPWYRFVREYHQNIGDFPASAYEIELLQSNFEILGPEVMSEAIRVTALKHASNPHRFMQSVCADWIEKDVHTIERARAVTMDHERQQKGGAYAVNRRGADEQPRRVGCETIL